MNASALLAFALSFAAPASGADDAARQADRGPTRVYVYENDDVDGLVLSPEGMPVPGSHQNKHPSLIEIRPHFMDSLFQQAQDI
jgi:hypothetical protein